MTSLGPALHNRGKKKLSGQISSLSRHSWAKAKVSTLFPTVTGPTLKMTLGALTKTPWKERYAQLDF
jgi:hypothetical protein